MLACVLALSMRTLLLIAAVLLSGCMSGTPIEGPSGAPTPTPTATDGVPPDLCCDTVQNISGGPPGAGGGMLVRPAHNDSTDSGFTLTADESVSGFYADGGNATFTFAGTNDGADAKVLSDPCGDGNPRVEIDDPNGTPLTLSPPSMRCMVASSFQDFPAGARLSRDLVWNGTYYVDGEPRVASEGTYTAVGTFEAQRDGRTVDVTTTIPINVLARGGPAIG